MDAELLLDARNAVGESPVWVVAEQALYWSDIPNRRCLRWREDGSVASWTLPEMAGCIAIGRAGRLDRGHGNRRVPPVAAGRWRRVLADAPGHRAPRFGPACASTTAAATARAACAPAPW
jgi:sugar lactone lactonase YvrE